MSEAALPEQEPPHAGPRPSPPLPSEGAQFRRLHPATIVVELLRRVGSFAYIIAIALIADFLGGHRESDWTEVVISGVLLLGVGGAIIRFVSVEYGLQDQSLVIRSGVLNRQIRTIPLDRIQNIDLRRGVLHRVLGVVDLSIETAGGGRPEVELSALSAAEAERLKTELLRIRQQAGAIETGELEDAAAGTEPDADVIWRASMSDLLLAGATENRAGVLVAALIGFWYTFGEVLFGRFASNFQRAYESLPGLSERGTTFLIFVGLMLVIAAGWLVSIVLTVVRYYGFVLRRREGDLRRRYGLFTEYETVLPLGRIQLLRLEAPWPRRLLRCYSLFAETAGSVLDQRRGESTPLSPLVRKGQLSSLCRQVFPELDLEQVTWQPVSRLTIRRGFMRYLLAGSLLLAGGALYFGWEVFYGLPVVLVIALVAAFARFRALGYAEEGQFVLARAGVWTRRIWIIPHSKVQFVSVSQSPFQRRMGLATVDVQTAGARSTSEAQVVDLPAARATALQDALADRAAATGAWLPDGV